MAIELLKGLCYHNYYYYLVASHPPTRLNNFPGIDKIQRESGNMGRPEEDENYYLPSKIVQIQFLKLCIYLPNNNSESLSKPINASIHNNR